MSMSDAKKSEYGVRTAIVKWFDISSRLALVTGSTRGLGYAMAEGLAAAGADVVVHGRSSDSAKNAATCLAETTGTPVRSCAFDMADPSAIDAAMATLSERIGTPDILVNNAGFQKRGELVDYDPADWQAMLATNLSGAFHVCRALGPAMRRRGSGKILFIGSAHSALPRRTVGAYATSKAGVTMFAKALSCELAEHGIQVNCLSPGFYRTDITRALWEDPAFDEWLVDRTPAGRWGEPADLLGTLIYLCAPASDFVTGQNLFVDGGLTTSM